MDKRIEEAIDLHSILNEQSKEISTFIDIEVKNMSALALKELMSWNKGGGKIPKAERSKFFSDALNILAKQNERYSYLLKNFTTSENKALYWRLKYQGVQSDALTYETLTERLQTALNEIEQLKQKYEK